MRNEIILTCVVAAAFLSGYLIQTAFEVKAFNKFSEKKASYIDGLFCQLRINAQ